MWFIRRNIVGNWLLLWLALLRLLIMVRILPLESVRHIHPFWPWGCQRIRHSLELMPFRLLMDTVLIAPCHLPRSMFLARISLFTRMAMSPRMRLSSQIGLASRLFGWRSMDWPRIWIMISYWLIISLNLIIGSGRLIISRVRSFLRRDLARIRDLFNCKVISLNSNNYRVNKDNLRENKDKANNNQTTIRKKEQASVTG